MPVATNEACPLNLQSYNQLPQRRQSDPTHQCLNRSNIVQFQSQTWCGSDDHDTSVLTVDRHWLPDRCEHFSSDTNQSHRRRPRSFKRRCFLFLTEFESSRGSAIFFVLLMVCIFVMNVVMIMQTMDEWQYTPHDCITCGGDVAYDTDDVSMLEATGSGVVAGVPCVCAPTPVKWTNTVLTNLIYFFTVEWILRVLLFDPPANDDGSAHPKFWGLWWAHLTDAATVMDALAIFPFYLEGIQNTNGLMSLRLLRLLRVFQLLRLGQYNATFWSLKNVLIQSIMYLRLLALVLVFGAALFGSMIYWLEKGSWRYHEETGGYRFMRIGVDGKTEEPSPFTSIPAAFWWFLVTATTVGYGDVYPTTISGKAVAVGAMLTGVLVVAFPVSVFSDLWAKEVRTKLLHRNNKTFDMGEDTTLVMPRSGTPRQNENSARRATNVDNIFSRLSALGSLQSRVEENNGDEVECLIDEMLACLNGIRENESRLRGLLQKHSQKQQATS